MPCCDAARTLAALAEAVVTCDGHGRLLACNPAAERLLGLREAEVLSRSLPSLLAETEVVVAAGGAAAWLGQLLAGPRTHVNLQRHGQPAFAAELVATPLSLPGRPPGLVCLIRDREGQLQLDQLKSEFVSVVSHELRTPLTSIRGAMKLVEGGVVGEVSAEVLELVRVARVNSDRLVRLVNDILDLEKMERGKLPMKRDELNAGRLLATAAESVQGMAREARVKIEIRNTLTGRLRGDEDRLVQVLTNLISNAVKFSPPGGEVLALATTLPGGRARFAVVDQGPGIAPEHRPRLFQKFQQLDSSDARLKGGTGLGLAIARAIVEEHGGQVGIDSIAGQGSTFWVELPMVAYRKSYSDPALLPDPSRFTVLVLVDDDEQLGELRATLVRIGYRFVGAGNLADARALLERLVPDAILLAPSLAGAELAQLDQLLASAERTREVRVVVLDPPIDEERLARSLRLATRPPGPPRVLVVDEDPHFHALLRQQLASLGLECSQASDAAEAAIAARSLLPDLIIVDAGMAELDSFGLVDALRQDRLRVTPLIVYSAAELSAADRAALTLGPTRHLSRSRTPELELPGAISALLEGLLPVLD